MRKIKEVLRLKWERGLSHRQIAAACGVSRPTVSEYLGRLAEAGLSWPLPEDLGEARLEQLLFPPPPDLPAEVRGIPDWHQIHEELKGKYVTLFLLWQEYRQANPEGYQYSWFCEHYRAWQGKLDLVMRQDHRAGEKLFVDYAGQTVPIIDRTTGEIHEAQVFVAVVPTRVRKPRDKAKVEGGVLIVERWILAALRHRQHFSLGQLNATLRELLEKLNRRPFRKLPGCRRDHFEQLDKPALQPLPAERYVYAEWKKARVNIDYHVAIDGHYYSVPYTLIKKEVEVRITHNIIECFYRGNRIASHQRSDQKGRHTTVAAHMPESHRQAGEWSPERLIAWAVKTGPATEKLIRTALSARKHPQQAYRSCLGILRLGKSYGEARLEAACRRALMLGSCRYKSIESILKHWLDQQPLEEQKELALPDTHDNIRGPAYYH
jgi:transposase